MPAVVVPDIAATAISTRREQITYCAIPSNYILVRCVNSTSATVSLWPGMGIECTAGHLEQGDKLGQRFEPFEIRHVSDVHN